MPQLGDLIFQLMGKPDPRQELLAAVGGGGTLATPPAAGDTSAAAAGGGGTAAPQQPAVYQSPPQLVDLYAQLIDRSERNANINRGVGLIGASLAQEANRPAILRAFAGDSGPDPTTLLNNVMSLQKNAIATQSRATQLAALPEIAAKYGLDLQTAKYLYDTGKLDEVISEAEKPDNQLIQDPKTGQYHIVDKKTGALSAGIGNAKDREIEIVDDPNTGEKFSVYKDTKERVGGKPIVEGQRKTEYVENPVTGGKQLVYSDTKEPVPDGNNLPGAGNTTDQQNYNAAMRGLPAEQRIPFNDWLTQQKKAGATQVNVGPTGINYGDPPKDMAWKRDKDGKVVTDEEGAPMAVPVKGGPMDVKNKEAAAKEAAQAADKATQGSIVVRAIDDATKTIADHKDDFIGATGWGSFLAGIPGTDALEAQSAIDTVRANVGFDKLQAMRAASQTGAALGPVSDFENKLLQATAGNLDLKQKPERVLRNLKIIRALYDRVINYGIKDQAEADKIMTDAAGEDLSDDDLLKKYGKK